MFYYLRQLIFLLMYILTDIYMKHLQLEFDYPDLLYLKLWSNSKSWLKASSVFLVIYLFVV